MGKKSGSLHKDFLIFRDILNNFGLTQNFRFCFPAQSSSQKRSQVLPSDLPPRILLTSSAEAWYELTAHTSESSLSVSDISITVEENRRLAG